MKHLLYILNIIIAILFFASCKDENDDMPGDDEPCYTILVSVPDEADTRAYYKEDGSDISVVWEKGDVVYVGTNEFVFKEMDGNNGLFYHYGELVGETSKVTFGFSPDDSYDQIQKKNNVCREVLEGTVPTDYKFKSSESPIPLLPSENKSLLHIQVKSPAMFVGGSLLKIKGLDQQDYNVTLGEDASHVFADEGEQMDVYVIVPSTLSINNGTTLKFYFYAYDENKKNAIDGDEYHYYMKSKAKISAANDKVVKLPLPNKPTHVAIQLGLPSGRKWATTNVGATSETEYGKFFWWGDVVGYVDNQNDASMPTPHNETGCDFSAKNNSIDTYKKTKDQLIDAGIIDAAGNLVPARDAAVQNWGDDWKMPTKDDFDELLKKCDWQWKTNPNRWVVKSKNAQYKGSIAFSMSGYINDNKHSNYHNRAYYRSSTIFVYIGTDEKKIDAKSWGIQLKTGNETTSIHVLHNDGDRYTGLPIRPVRK